MRRFGRLTSPAASAALLSQLMVGAPAHGQGQAQAAAPATPSVAAFQAEHIALERGAGTCVGLLHEALKLNVEAAHVEASSWHLAQPDLRTFWTVQADKGGNRATWIGVTPTEGRHCDASTVRVDWSKQECKAVAAGLQKGGASPPQAMADAILIRQDASGKAVLLLPAGGGCTTVEMATLYGR
jgi:hypothetical protein